MSLGNKKRIKIIKDFRLVVKQVLITLLENQKQEKKGVMQEREKK